MTDKNREMMQKLIDAKKQKSAQQGGFGRFDKRIGEKRTATKKYKKGGLFDK